MVGSPCSPRTLKSLLQHHSSKASSLQHSAFFTVQLSHPYMTTGKIIALTRRTFVGKVMSLLLNMLSRLVSKKAEKTTRPFRYDLNQIPYVYTVEVRNSQGIRSDRVPEELWTDVHDIVQEAVIKTIPKKKKCKKAKQLSEEALQIAEKRREVKGKGER